MVVNQVNRHYTVGFGNDLLFGAVVSCSFIRHTHTVGPLQHWKVTIHGAFLAASPHTSSFQSQPVALAHCSTCKCLPSAAPLHVSSFQTQAFFLPIAATDELCSSCKPKFYNSTSPSRAICAQKEASTGEPRIASIDFNHVPLGHARAFICFDMHHSWQRWIASDSVA